MNIHNDLNEAKKILGMQVMINNLAETLDKIRGAGTLNQAFILADDALEKLKSDSSGSKPAKEEK